MARTKKPKPVVVVKDFLGQEVNAGDEVIVLYKVRGYRALDNAYLWRTVYLGKGKYGYQFENKFPSGKFGDPINIRQPEMIKITNQIVVKIPESPGLKKEVQL